MTPLFWQRLDNGYEPLIAGFPGVAGVAVKELTDGQTLALNAG